MKRSLDIQKLKFYLWVSLVYTILWVIIDLATEANNYFARGINNIWLSIFLLVVNYYFFEDAVPFIRRRKSIFVKILLFILVIWIQLMLYAEGLFGWRYIGILLGVYTPLKTFSSFREGSMYIFPHGLISIFFYGVGRHIYSHLQLRQAAQQLRIEKQQAELNYLKSQTNPHFLFNTLNNIYSLARDKSDKAPESILRLSKILRFMLYETSGEYISIEDELKIMTDYIALEKLRYDESLRVNFNYDVEDMKQAIPPLLMMPLVENAFKHGVAETRSRPFVDIHLSVKQRQLTFAVKNSIESSPEEPIKENIGLSNLRRQLELLYTDSNLSVQHTDSVFTASLKINLASHV